MKPAGRDAGLRLLVHIARPYRLAFGIAIALGTAEAGGYLLLPWLAGLAAVRLFSETPWQPSDVLVALAALLTLQATLQAAGTALFNLRATRVLADLRMHLFRHLLRIPVGYVQSSQQGRMLSILSNDVEIVSHFLSTTLVGLVPLAVTLIGSMLLMLSIDARLALCALAAIPIFLVLLKLFGRSVRPTSIALQEAHAQAFAVEEENVEMLPVVKSFARECHEAERYGRRLDTIKRLTVKQLWIDIALGPAVFWCASMAALAMLWLATDRIQTGLLDKAAVISLLLYASLLTRPVSTLAGLYGQSQRALASLDRVVELLGVPGEQYNSDAPSLAITGGSITLDRIRFTYPGRVPLFRDLSLTVNAGETVALVGENGAGKSTIVSLILRFAVPDGGSILIDGQDIASVGLESLRRQIAVVPQTVFLFNGSIRDNLAYGDIDATDDQIEHAARLAQAHTFIAALPEGYQTRIGDHGARLSGGQRQRLALARALLKNPRILILDEATAMFDPEAELAFLRDCRAIFAGRTVLLITHRPASLEVADRIIRIVPAPVVPGNQE